jgi:hypothetical protein
MRLAEARRTQILPRSARRVMKAMDAQTAGELRPLVSRTLHSASFASVPPSRRDYKVACPAVRHQLSGTLGKNVILCAFALSGLDCQRRRMPGFSWLCGRLVCRCVHGPWP